MIRSRADSSEVHRATVDRLVANALPVTRLWPVRRQLALWCTLSGALLAGSSASQLRADLAQRVTDPTYVASAVLLLSAAIVTAMLAFRAAEPGREARHRESLGAILLVTGALLLTLAAPPSHDPVGSLFSANAARCLSTAVTLAALPLVTLLLALGRGAPVRAALAGAQAGAAAFLVAAFQLHLLCPLDDRLHLLALHFAPIGLASLVSSGLCGAWFRRRAAARGRQMLAG